MVYRVVSTKLTEEEHSKLLDECNRKGCTPSNLIKNAVLKELDVKPLSSMNDTELEREFQKEKSRDLTIEELRHQLRLS